MNNKWKHLFGILNSNCYIMEKLYKQYKYTLLATSSLHNLSKVIVFQLESVHKQDEELSLKHGCSHTMLKNDFGNISV